MKPTLAAANQFTPMLKKRQPNAETPQVLLKLEDLQTPVSKKNTSSGIRDSLNLHEGNNGIEGRSFSVNQSDIDPQEVYADIKALLFTALEKLSILEKQGSFSHSSYSDASTQTNEVRRAVSVKRGERSRSAKQQQLQQQKIAQRQSEESSSNNSTTNNTVKTDSRLKKVDSSPESCSETKKTMLKSISESDCRSHEKSDVKEKQKRKLSSNQSHDEDTNTETVDSSQKKKNQKHPSGENQFNNANRFDKADSQKSTKNDELQNNDAILLEEKKHVSYYSNSSDSEVKMSLRKTNNSPVTSQKASVNSALDGSSAGLNI